MRLIDEGEYDLAMFNLEQFCQLILKYELLVNKGIYSRTHSLRRLIRELGVFKTSILELVNNVHNLHYIARLEEAYISSRSMPITYEEEEVKDILKFVKEVFMRYVEDP